jgi:hypothetical protein
VAHAAASAQVDGGCTELVQDTVRCALVPAQPRNNSNCQERCAPTNTHTTQCSSRMAVQAPPFRERRARRLLHRSSISSTTTTSCLLQCGCAFRGVRTTLNDQRLHAMTFARTRLSTLCTHRCGCVVVRVRGCVCVGQRCVARVKSGDVLKRVFVSLVTRVTGACVLRRVDVAACARF